MLIVEMVVFRQTLKNVISAAMPGYINDGLSAHLMSPSFVPDAGNQQSWADVLGFEVFGKDYRAEPLTGLRVVAEGSKVSIQSDAILFGDPITIAPFRYLLFATGLPGAAAGSKKLVAYGDLAAGGGAREVVRGSLVFSHGTHGWLSFSQS